MWCRYFYESTSLQAAFYIGLLPSGVDGVDVFKPFSQKHFFEFMTPLLEKIKNNGFDVQLDDDGFTVSPSEKLTNEQREFLKSNKSQIMTELLLTTVYNLNGVPMQIQAENAEHQKWLIAVNHKSTTPVNTEGWLYVDE